MLVTKMRIDGQFFYLDDGVDIPALKEQIIRAASGPPAFITFRSVGHGEVSVLMGPHFPARFETEEHSAAEVAALEVDPPDVDPYFFLSDH